jgi:2'-5' RNA ligase
VLWVGTLAPELDAIAAAVDTACVAEGFAAEARPFHGHCTLGRVRPGRGGRGADRATVARVLEALTPDDAHAFGGSPASELVLFRSDTDPRGARYSALARLPFAVDAAFTPPR